MDLVAVYIAHCAHRNIEGVHDLNPLRGGLLRRRQPLGKVRKGNCCAFRVSRKYARMQKGPRPKP